MCISMVGRSVSQSVSQPVSQSAGCLYVCPSDCLTLNAQFSQPGSHVRHNGKVTQTKKKKHLVLMSLV